MKGVTITHEDRVLDPASGVTKGELARYCAAVARELLSHAKNRPLSIVRCTDAIGKGCFFQKHAMPGLGDSVHRSRIGDQEVLSVTTTGLLQLVQLGGIELHAWGSRLPAADKPDRMVLDLDPDEGLPYGRVVEAALEARELLRGVGLEAWVKTTGGKGLHVVVPFRPEHGWEVVKGFARAIAEDFARRAPGAFTVTMAKAARRGRIFVDYLRNDAGATAVVPTLRGPAPASPWPCQSPGTTFVACIPGTSRCAPSPISSPVAAAIPGPICAPRSSVCPKASTSS